MAPTNDASFPLMDKALATVAHSWQFQAAYHQGQLQRIKKNLGKDCLHLAHETEGGKRFIKVVMLNELGGRDRGRIEIESKLHLVREKEYDRVMKFIGEKKYVRSTKRV